MAQSNSVIAETIRPISQHPSYDQRYKATKNDFKRVIHYNNNFDLNKKVEFINIHLLCNKLSLQFLVNDATICPKKCRVNDIEDEAAKASKTNTTKKKKVSIKRIRKKSSKALVPILKLVKHPTPDVPALLIKTNIVILALHLFQILLKFKEEIRRFITVPCKPCKKKVIHLAFEEKKELYTGFDYLKQV